MANKNHRSTELEEAVRRFGEAWARVKQAQIAVEATSANEARCKFSP